jgi:hypothetical protein
MAEPGRTQHERQADGTRTRNRRKAGEAPRQRRRQAVRRQVGGSTATGETRGAREAKRMANERKRGRK